MSVKHSLLAILSSGPTYGYQLKVEFERRTASTWPLNIGQVYGTLERLARDGLVESLGEDAEGRVRYTISDAGRSELAAWFRTPTGVTQPPRNDLAIKFTVAAATPGVDLRELIQTQRTATIRTLQHYTLAKRRADSGDVAWLLVVEQLILHAEAEVRWLDAAERLASTLPSPATGAPAPCHEGPDAISSASPARTGQTQPEGVR